MVRFGLRDATEELAHERRDLGTVRLRRAGPRPADGSHGSPRTPLLWVTVRTPTDLARFKSSYSGSSGDDCVEVAACLGTVHVRDSKVTEGPQLALPSGAWTSFVSYVAVAGV